MQLEWDENKNRGNKRKHGISFETASLVFQDPFVISMPDKRYNYEEERWQSIGLVESIVIYVAHTIIEEEENDEEIIRIISARAATSSEERRYLSYKRGGERT
jgi:uncharacterized protein